MPSIPDNRILPFNTVKLIEVAKLLQPRPTDRQISFTRPSQSIDTSPITFKKALLEALTEDIKNPKHLGIA